MPDAASTRGRAAPAGIAPDGRDAWARLAHALLLSTIGSVGLWSVVVVLPAVSAEFALERSSAALSYTGAMIGFAFGGVLMGRLADRRGIVWPLLAGATLLPLGYLAAALSPNFAVFALAHALLIGPGASASFAPLLADSSLYFDRRRGIAVAVVASGNYLAGALWPTLLQHAALSFGWRATHLGVAAATLVLMLPLSLSLRGRPIAAAAAGAAGAGRRALRRIDLPRPVLYGLLIVAGIACCVAMAMPQVHIVAYCGDLGYGVARGAEMLSVMLACGIVSRVASGFVADRIGGIPTLLISSVLQGVSLALFLVFDSLGALYLVSALFGLVQGGIVPSYAVIVREYFPAGEAGTRVGTVVMATLLGMALGGWISGVIFDATGSYVAAFLNGIGWNLLNVSVTLFLLTRTRGGGARMAWAAA